MAFEVSCTHCSARFSLTADLYARKIKGRIATIRCRRCGSDVVVDATAAGGLAANLKPLTENPSAEPLSERRISHASLPDATPTIAAGTELPPDDAWGETAAVSARRQATTARLIGAKPKPEPPPVPRKSPPKASKALWVVSYGPSDDRELTLLQIRSALVRGEIHGGSLVWQDGMGEWQPLWQVAELAAIVPKQGDVLLHKLPGERAPRRPTSTPPPKPTSGTPRGFVNAPPRRAPMRSSPDVAPPPVPVRDERPKTRPDLPSAKARANAQRDSIPDAEEVPPSSGVPALSALTHREPERRVPKQQTAEELLLGAPKGEPEVTRPTIDVSSLTNSVARTPKRAAPTPPRPPPRRAAPAETPAAEAQTELEPTPVFSSPPSETKDDGERSSEQSSEPTPEPARPVVVAASPKPVNASDSDLPSDHAALLRDSSGGPTQEAKSKAALWIGLVAIALVAGFLLLFRSPDGKERPIETDVPEAPSAAARSLDPAPESPLPNPAEPEPTPARRDSNSAVAAAASRAAPPSAEASPNTASKSRASERTAGEPASDMPPPKVNAKEPAAEPVKPTPEEPAKSEPAVAPKPKEPAEPATEPFDKSAAVAAVNTAAAAASACRQDGDPSGVAAVVITFTSSGRVTSATISGPPFAGTATGGCIARTLRQVRVPPFVGDHVTVSKSVVIQ